MTELIVHRQEEGTFDTDFLPLVWINQLKFSRNQLINILWKPASDLDSTQEISAFSFEFFHVSVKTRKSLLIPIHPTKNFNTDKFAYVHTCMHKDLKSWQVCLKGF
jgi:hypothetical protein